MTHQNRHCSRTVLICLLLALTTLAIFWPSFGHDFLTYDDQQYVTENPHVQAGLSLPSIKWAFRSNEASNWHPLTWLSHMLDCQLYGMKPWGHHLTNLLLHTATTIFLFLLLQGMTNAPWSSAMVAALFGWHPMHVESVAWVAERKDVLSAFFMMLTLLAYVRYVNQFKVQGSKFKVWYGIALICFALGLMSKPMLVTLPFVLLLLDCWPLKRNADRSEVKKLVIEKIPFFVLSAVSCGLTIWAQNAGHAIVPASELSVAQRIQNSLVASLEYLGKAVLPLRMAVFYPLVQPPLWKVLAAALILLSISLFVVKQVSRRPWFFVGWFWFLGMLVPVIGLVQVGDQAMADRYTYLPYIGLFIVFVWGARELAGQNWIAKAGAVIVLAGAAIGTSAQLRYWKDTRTLFEHTARVTRCNYVASGMLGSLLAKEGDYDAAIKFYSDALGCNPNFPEAHFFLGNAYEKQGRPNDAMAEYATALRLRPHFEQAHIFLGLALAKANKSDEALQHFQSALAINPDSAVAHHNIAKIFQAKGQLDEAARHYSAALALDPKLAPAHNNLGIVRLLQDRPADGAAELKEALKLEPDNLETQYNLALALNQFAQWPEAGALWEKVARAKPNDANAAYQWGLALSHLQRTKEAMSCYAHALLLNENFPDALNALAWILATDPHPEFRNGTEAVKLADKACELTGRKQAAYLKTLAAAYAETGKFDEAVSTAQQARELALAEKGTAESNECNRMLDAFRKKNAYRREEN